MRLLLLPLALVVMIGAGTSAWGQFAPDDSVEDWSEEYLEPTAVDRPLVWSRFEYLMWFSHGRSVPALATTDIGLSPISQAGVLPPVGNGQVVFGDNRIGRWIRNGGRLTLGAAIDPDGIWNFESRFVLLEQSQQNGHFAVGNDEVLARPFFRVDPDPTLSRQDSLLLTYPGISRDGRIDIRDASDYFAADATTKAILWDDGVHQFHGRIGYQYARIDNSLEIRTSQVVIGPPLAPPPLAIGVYDLFDTQNHFHGMQVGGGWTCYTDRLSLEIAGRMSVGSLYEKLFIGGTTSIGQEGSANVVTTPGGFLASSNSGTYTRNRFVYSPEVNANLVYHWRPHISLVLGYSFVYWSRVALAGNNVDPAVNLTGLGGNVVGEDRPHAYFRETDLWLMGLNLGFEATF